MEDKTNWRQRTVDQTKDVGKMLHPRAQALYDDYLRRHRPALLQNPGVKAKHDIIFSAEEHGPGCEHCFTLFPGFWAESQIPAFTYKCIKPMEKPWNAGTLQPWNPETLEPWNLGTLELNAGNLEPWNLGRALESWNLTTLEPWKRTRNAGAPERWKSLELWNLRTLKSWSLKLCHPATLERSGGRRREERREEEEGRKDKNKNPMIECGELPKNTFGAGDQTSREGNSRPRR